MELFLYDLPVRVSWLMTLSLFSFAQSTWTKHRCVLAAPPLRPPPAVGMGRVAATAS